MSARLNRSYTHIPLPLRCVLIYNHKDDCVVWWRVTVKVEKGAHALFEGDLIPDLKRLLGLLDRVGKGDLLKNSWSAYLRCGATTYSGLAIGSGSELCRCMSQSCNIYACRGLWVCHVTVYVNIIWLHRACECEWNKLMMICICMWMNVLVGPTFDGYFPRLCPSVMIH